MLLICMSIAGSVPLVLCILLWMIKRKNFSYWLGRDLVLLSLAGYLIPFQLVKYLLPTDFLKHTKTVTDIRYFSEFSTEESLSYQGFSLWIPHEIFFLVLIWFAAVILFSVYEIIKYRYLTKHFKQNSAPKEIGISSVGKINIRVTDQICAPYTIGFFHPFIIFPQQLLSTDLADSLLKHEYSHMRRHDSLVKLICLLAICIHWFNPLALLTLFFYTTFSENVADAFATDNLSKEDLKTYAIALVNYATNNKEIPIVWRSNFIGGKLFIKRRIEFIMRRNIKASKLTTTAVVLASMLLGSSTVLAYSPMQTSNFEENINVDEGAISFNSSNTFAEDFSESDLIFESLNHEITPIYDSDISTRAIICTHDFEIGYASQHIANSNGGCTVKVYNAKKCRKCNHLVITDLISTTKYVKCPH